MVLGTEVGKKFQPLSPSLRPGVFVIAKTVLSVTSLIISCCLLIVLIPFTERKSSIDYKVVYYIADSKLHDVEFYWKDSSGNTPSLLSEGD